MADAVGQGFEPHLYIDGYAAIASEHFGPIDM